METSGPKIKSHVKAQRLEMLSYPKLSNQWDLRVPKGLSKDTTNSFCKLNLQAFRHKPKVWKTETRWNVPGGRYICIAGRLEGFLVRRSQDVALLIAFVNTDLHALKNWSILLFLDQNVASRAGKRWNQNKSLTNVQVLRTLCSLHSACLLLAVDNKADENSCIKRLQLHMLQ